MSAASPEELNFRLRAIVEHALDVFYVKDLRGRYLLINPAGAAVFGLTPEQVEGLTDHDLFDPEQARDIRRWDQRVLAERQSVSYETRRSVGGKPRVFLTRKYPYRDSKGEVAGTMGLSQDVTEWRQLEGQLAEAERLASLGTLAAGVAHEVNNPLTVVTLQLRRLAERLGAGPLKPGEQAALAKRAREGADAAERIARTTSELLLYARGGDDAPGVTDVGACLRRAASMADNQVRHRAELQLELPALPAVAADEARLVRVFVNLLVNAAQAIEPGAKASNRIDVSAQEQRDGVLVRVSDTGPGLPPAVAERLFEPFVSTKGPGEGTGLGLWVSAGIVRGCGGRIEATSSASGTTFEVWLPRADEAAISAETLPPPAPTWERVPVLVVDDEELIGQLLAEALADVAQVDWVVSVEQARQRLQADDYGLVLCDVMMPDGSGPELLAWLRERDPTQARRLVFVTGGVFGQEERAQLEASGTKVLGKPFRIEAVRALVAEAAQEWSAG